MWLPRVTVAAVIKHQGKFLLVEEKSDDRLVFNQPAGHWDQGETLTDAVAREVMEETGWEFHATHLLGVYNWTHPTNNTTYLRFAFAGNLGAQKSPAPLDKDIVRTVWLSEDEVLQSRDKHRSPLIWRCIQDFNGNQRYPLDVLRDIA